MVNQLALINHSKQLSPEALAAFVGALDVQLRVHLPKAWGKDVMPWVAGSNFRLSPSLWQLHIWDEVQEARHAGAMGRHETVGATYTPQGHVFLNPVARAKEDWTVIASHEALELAMNPELNLSTVREVDGGVEAWAREVCDPVQGSTYEVHGVKLANFVYPEFFIPGSDGPWDHLQLLKGPFTLLETGYASVLKAQGPLVQRDLYPESIHASSSPPRPSPHPLARVLGVRVVRALQDGSDRGDC